MRAALITLMLVFGLLAGTECVSEVMIQEPVAMKLRTFSITVYGG